MITGVNLDRFSSGLPDPQDELPAFECKVCGMEIYKGEDYYDIDGWPCCNDVECITALAGIRKETA